MAMLQAGHLPNVVQILACDTDDATEQIAHTSGYVEFTDLFADNHNDNMARPENG